MTVYAVLNPKGGAGKTTVAIGLGRALALDDKDVALVDSDVQGSLQDWARANPDQPMQVFSIKQSALVSEIPKLANEFVIIDGLAKAASLTETTLKVADVVIIPVPPSPLDVWACAELVYMIQDRIQELEGTGRTLKAYFLVSRAVRGAKLSEDIAATLEGYGYPVLKTQLVFRQDHPKSHAAGQTPLDIKPRGAAANELRALKDELLALAAQ